MNAKIPIPSREEVIQLVARTMYSASILNNSHRGDLVEMLVLSALGPEWKFVGLGWHPWDLQRGTRDSRVRIQVKHSAALQLWGKTQRQALSFGWSNEPPSYFEQYNPGEVIESEGWFCEVFVFGIHEQVDANTVDQVDPGQWRFLVIPTCDLRPRTKSMVLTKALETWPPIPWNELRRAVDQAVERMT
ncbi:MAG: hypothetical protein E2O55_02410 [Gammaproteobacteria bacterium]|nr:MAG: hypothetical protein E2O55_02410 [Gammaproteobacteria bacterium]